MKRQTFLFNLFVMFLIIGMTSCGSKVPDGMPKIYPSSIKVTKDGSPLADATVQLIPAANSSTNINVSGITDASGVAKITTGIGTYSAEGAPEGEFKVLVQKDVELEMKSRAELDSMEYGDRLSYLKEYEAEKSKLPRIIPDSLTRGSTTPLTVSVTTAGGELLSVEISDYE